MSLPFVLSVWPSIVTACVIFFLDGRPLRAGACLLMSLIKHQHTGAFHLD